VNIEKELAEKQACSEDACADSAFGSGEGIAFRNRTPQSQQDVIVECAATTDIDSDSRETDLEDVLTPLVELDEREKLTSDWFAFKKLIHEPPTAEDTWNDLCQVRHCLWIARNRLILEHEVCDSQPVGIHSSLPVNDDHSPTPSLPLYSCVTRL
jgi:hypothetical protein